MKNHLRFALYAAGLIAALSLSAFAQQAKRAEFDVTNYQIDAALAPNEKKLNATADVTFTPLEDTRTVSFELNGSLKIDSITRLGAAGASSAAKRGAAVKSVPAPASQGTVTYVQDQTGVGDLGPSVRIDLGDTVTKGTPVVLRFKYSGVLDGPAGGPLLTKRLAYVGDDYGYLMYAARWFPFHDYAADLATSDITISVPGGMQVVGYNDTGISGGTGKLHFVQSKPALIGNFAYGKYVTKPLHFGDYDLQFFTRPGRDATVASFGETLGKALDFYTKKYGGP
jgi:Aminopeptidase N